jgi:hypothetical protein
MALVLAVGLVMLSLGPVVAETAAKPRLVRLEGWVVDEWCAKNNAEPEKSDCVLACQKKGAALVFYTPDDHKLYALTDQKAALEHVGHKVKVIGTVDAAGALNVGSWIEPKAAGQSES